MASTDEFQVTVKGKGGHGAVPHETIDSIVAASHFVVALQSVVSRNLNPLDSGVLTIGKVRGGSIMNAIADQVVMNGTQRSYLPETRALLSRRLRELGTGIDAAFGTRTLVEVFERYPATVNDPEITRVVSGLAQDLIGSGCLETEMRLMGAEDMSFYLQEIPGCFLFLGAGNSSKGFDRPHHNPRFDIDEDALPIGVEMFVRFVDHFVGGRARVLPT